MSTFRVETVKDQIYLIFNSNINADIMSLMCSISEDEEFYNEGTDVRRRADVIFEYLPIISTYIDSGNSTLVELYTWLSEKFQTKLKRLKKMSDDGRVTFDNIPSMFKQGVKVVGYVNGELYGGTMKACRIDSYDGIKRYCTMTVTVVKSNGTNLIDEDRLVYVYEYKGLRSTTELPLSILTEKDERILNERGKIFMKYAIGIYHLHCTGNMVITDAYMFTTFINCNGRIMIDPVGMNIVNPNRMARQNQFQHINGATYTTLSGDKLFATWPFLNGFSFRSKQWGEIPVNKLETIKFDEDAFNLLVLDSKIKCAMNALVTSCAGSFRDIITGKSGGTIFLLHGPPGTGKTLTTEAISEYLKRPLYSITVGELGITPEVLEKRLTLILETAKRWDAVILIDEVDVFLEQRNDNDIKRNAMVGIFLRLLERHHGVMFLTTNRADKLDSAIRSRISMIVQYEKLNEEALISVWNNLLSAAHISLAKDEIRRLAQLPVSGRDIIHIIRGSQSLATNGKVPVSYALIEQFVGLRG